jgi:ATP-dependent protease HslVU (ClpYQ) peptidase subunit
VTVCIAAVGSENTIITASDLKITKGYYSADIVSLKTWRIHPKWTAMLAGKISHHWPVTGELSRRLDDHKEYLEEDVADLCTKAYISYQRKLAYEKVLSPFGLSLDSFLAKRAELGDTMFERLWGEISRVQVGFDMLVVGFVGESPRIFVVSNPSEENPSFITYCDDVQFAAIGSGGYAAESTLFALSEYLGSSTESKIYQVLAAKFSSESASDVGTATYLRVLRPDGTAIRMDADFIEAKIRREWEDFGRPRMRPKGFALIKEALKVAESEQGSVGS